MNTPQEPKPQAAPTAHNLEARMQALVRLRTQMEELHAHLEYMKLMLKLRGPQAAAKATKAPRPGI